MLSGYQLSLSSVFWGEMFHVEHSALIFSGKAFISHHFVGKSAAGGLFHVEQWADVVLAGGK